MKTFSLVLLMAVLAVGSFAAGRRFARSPNSASATEPSTMPMFDSHFNALSVTEAAIEAIDAGRIDDAKHQLRLNQDGNILALDQLWDSEHEATRDGAEKLLTRIAKHRAEHPWKYSGSLPALTNAEVEAKVSTVLSAASKKQNQ
jgi:hypothetical protein